MKKKIVLALLMLAIIVAGVVLMDRELFRVRAVVVNGCETRPAEEVTALSGIRYDERIFAVDLGAVADNVSQSPFYRVEGVARLYPDRVRITVHERVPKAAALNLGAYLIMDEEGYVLEIRSDKGYAQCPMVEGLKITTYNVGQQVALSDALQLRAMGSVLTALDEQEAVALVSKIELDNVLDIRLTTVDGYRVMLGDTDNLGAKLSWLKGSLASLRGEGMYGGTIYLSANNASYMPQAVAASSGDGEGAGDDWSFGAPADPPTGEGGEGEGEGDGGGGEPETPTDLPPGDGPEDAEPEP